MYGVEKGFPTHWMVLRFVLALLILKVKNGYALVTNLNMISARFMEKTFGGPVGTIAFNFNDMKTIFDLGWMETNLIHVLCLLPLYTNQLDCTYLASLVS